YFLLLPQWSKPMLPMASVGALAAAVISVEWVAVTLAGWAADHISLLALWVALTLPVAVGMAMLVVRDSVREDGIEALLDQVSVQAFGMGALVPPGMVVEVGMVMITMTSITITSSTTASTITSTTGSS